MPLFARVTLSVHTGHRPPSEGRRPETRKDRSRLERCATHRSLLSDRPHALPSASVAVRVLIHRIQDFKALVIWVWLFTSPWVVGCRVICLLFSVVCGGCPVHKTPHSGALVHVMSPQVLSCIYGMIMCYLCLWGKAS